MGHSAKYHFSNTCRRCINRRYGLTLRSADCYYWPYPARCRECGEVCNIVSDFTFLTKWKLRFHLRSRSDERDS